MNPNIRGFLAEELQTRRADTTIDETQPKMKMKKKYKGKKRYVSYNAQPTVDFAVPMWQRLMIEATEGIKTIKGVGKDLVTKKAYTDPKKNKMWTEDLGRGFTESRERVRGATKQANKKNIMNELEKNKALDLQVDKMRQAGKKTYKEKGIPDLSRASADGVLDIDKRFKRGAKYG